MADTYAPPFSGMTDVEEVVSAAAQTEILGKVDLVIALINPGEGESSPHPDFDRIPPGTADLLRNELAALKAAIDAAPTA